IRIDDYAMARRVNTTRDSLGYAVLFEGWGVIGSVYYHRAVELARRNLAAQAAILGCIMAHEIGHLLLSEPGHSRDGIMRANWGDEDLKRIAEGRMWFAPEQGARMAEKIGERERAAKEQR